MDADELDTGRRRFLTQATTVIGGIGIACLAYQRAAYLSCLCTRITSLVSIALKGNAYHFDQQLFAVRIEFHDAAVFPSGVQSFYNFTGSHIVNADYFACDTGVDVSQPPAIRADAVAAATPGLR